MVVTIVNRCLVLLVAVFAVLGPLSYRGYSLDRARHREILAALARRNEDSRTASDHDAT